MNRLKYAPLAIVVLVVVGLGFMWGGIGLVEEQPVSQSISDSLSSGASLEVAFKVSVAQYGLRDTLTFAPSALAFSFWGTGGLGAQIFLAASLTIVLLYLIAEHFLGSQTALTAVFLFVLLPLIYKFAAVSLALLSPVLLSLFAIYCLLRTGEAPKGAHKALALGLCAAACAVHAALYAWGIWLAVFLALYWFRDRRWVQLGFAIFSLCALAVYQGWPGLSGQAALFDGPNTPIRQLFSTPDAVQIGYLSNRPQFSYELSGSMPAILLVIYAFATASSEHRKLLDFVGLWLLAAITLNFGFLQAGYDVALLVVMPPIAMLVAVFFERLYLRPLSTLVYAILFLALGALLRAETLSEIFVIGPDETGWATKLPWHDVARISGGLLIFLFLVYLWVEKWLPQNWRGAILNIMFGLLGFSQIGLVSLLRITNAAA